MKISRILLKDFRNYSSLDMDFSPEVNLLYGDNAQGKTNLLESVFLLATTKGLRSIKDSEMIRLGTEDAHLCAWLEKNGVPHKIDMHLKLGRTKSVAIDGIPIRRSADLMGLMHTIAFSPDDLSMIKNGPGERRRFMDLELCQLSPVYCRNLTDYNKILKQRNQLLKQLDVRSDYMDTLDVWDEQLVRYGIPIIRERQKFIEDLAELVQEKMNRITEEKEFLKLHYECDVAEEEFLKSLQKNRQRDVLQRQTSHGPHRDDVGFYINDLNVRQFGSQGQQRTVVLALKLAELQLVKRRINDTPILLLDDVLSELDRSRQLKLLSEISNVQTIVTCTGMEEFVAYRKEDPIGRIYYVKNGTVERKEYV